MRLIGRSRLAAAAVATALAGLCIGVSATSASASTPVLYASHGDVAHQCTIIGQDSHEEQAVVCVDMRTHLSSSGVPVVDAYGELYCQLPDGYTLRCLQANGYGTLSTATTGPGFRYQPSCSGSACSTGRNVWFIGEMTFSSSNCQSSLANNAWAVLYGQGALTNIQLASYDAPMYLGSPAANDSGNQSTGHYQICP